MRLKNIFLLSLLYCFIVVNTSCKKDPETPPMGTLEGTVSSAADASALADVDLVIFDALTNEPTGATLITDASGFYTTDLAPGTYYVRAYKQGFLRVPPPSVAPLGFDIIDAQTTVNDFEMFVSDVVNGGFITGQVTDGTNGVAGALVVADNGTDGYSTISDADGNYKIYNIPAGDYSVNGQIAGYNSTATNTTVNGGAETADVTVTLTAGTAGSVAGAITFLSTNNIEVDVALVNQYTREAIPGLNAMTSSFNYTISDVPDGTYLARATYANDTKVMDPDWIVKNGEPYVTVSGASEPRDFSVTGSVSLSEPTNPAASVQPVEVTSTTPVFTWMQYASSSDYVIEVSDASGNVVWGGFNADYSVKNVIIPAGTLSVTFGDINYGTAPSADLVPGKIYRWRVYASKDDAQAASGFRLISVSEDQRGLIKIVAP